MFTKRLLNINPQSYILHPAAAAAGFQQWLRWQPSLNAGQENTHIYISRDVEKGAQDIQDAQDTLTQTRN